ncbi:MAG: alpha/beta hydrolase [Roseibium album]|uniref:alpha/beta hydrolase n=1 Tax=Roseibium album TaxID=311410 RepID=UPI0018C9206C|nr:arylformamidase [Labrenzia sp. EL_162]MBG6198757.1 arylformamidase [Labrenzia sp. EL_159]MCR9058640.1 alpha/beta hydrolase [Paracoccaceae bacterium]
MNWSDERETWDCQFRFSDVLPDFATWLDWRNKASRKVGQAVSFERVAYGGHARQWFETTRFKGPQPQIVPVFIHGGYWRALSAEEHRCVLPGLSSLGTACVNVEYRLMPEFRLDELVSDSIAAIRTIANLYPDETRLLLVGHSAGAHLAISAAMKSDIANRLSGVIAVSGVYDLVPVAKSFLQDEISLSEAEIVGRSLVGVSLDVPLLCVVGGNETDEFKTQSRVMAENAGSGHLIVRGAHHLSILADLSAENSPLIEALGHWAGGAGNPEEVDTIAS